MFSFAERPGFKFFLVGALGFMLMVPLAIVYALLAERQSRSASVVQEVGRDWGGEQAIFGPFLVVPFNARETVRDSVTNQTTERTVRRHAVFSIDDLTIDGQAEAQIRRRSIFEVPVYRAALKFSGRVSSPEAELKPLDVNPADALWDEASFVLAIEDPRAIKEPIALRIDGAASPVTFRPTLALPVFGRGVHAPLTGVDPRRGFAFSFDLILNGAGSLRFSPAARDTKVLLAANWPHPSYEGAFLPEERSEPGEAFFARWRIPDLARTLQLSWVLAPVGGGFNTTDSQYFGVRLYQPGTVYQLVERSVKYGVLFIGAIFMTVFVMEIRSRRSFHPVQYILVGLALILFFVLLLSFSEQIGFLEAYLIASGATVGLVTLYVSLAMRSLGSGFILAIVLSALLALLNVILSLEDYALLAGAIASFIGLAVVMLATTRIDWSASPQRA